MQQVRRAWAMERTTARTAALGRAAVATGALSALGCGASSPPPTMQGRAGMLSQTAVAQKCGEAARGHDRPFVVEWDATDLASFETKAARDTIVVKYEGCTLDVLYACSDAIAGHFGSYGAPHPTSGGVQGFDVGNSGDLYTKLPLGAAQLSARVEAGETLHLKYFVSGVATDTRDALYRDELAKVPACAGATHFVWAYNLGAFELATSEKNDATASASVGTVGAGGDHAHSAQQLAQGGDLASCTTNDQRACHVPIRLALRAIAAGPNPASALPGAGAGAEGSGALATLPGAVGAPVDYEATPAGQARQAFHDASDKLKAGDGAGCLALLDRITVLDVRQAEGGAYALMRNRCLMRKGQCDEGQRAERSRLAGEDVDHQKTDAELDREALVLANRECPSSTAKRDVDFVLRASRELVEAAQAKDGGTCMTLFDRLDQRLGTLPKTPSGALSGEPLARTQEAIQARNQGLLALDRGAFCVATFKGCAAGLPYWRRAYTQHLPGQPAALIDRVSHDSWETLTRQQRVQCK